MVREAVSCGLIDQLGGLSDALGWLHQTIDSRAKKSRETGEKITKMSAFRGGHFR